jgi:hypothetical protein
LYREFYSRDPVHAAFVVRGPGAGRFFVPLGEATVTFGRLAPYADIRLFDSLLTKRHFEIFWDATVVTHGVYDRGRFSLALDGRLLAERPDRVLRHARDPYDGDRHLLHDGNVLEIGHISLEYVSLAAG